MLDSADDRLAREHVQQLRPEVAAEALGLDGAQDGGHLELPGRLREQGDVVDEGGAVDIGHPEGHLR